jgi:hypothetical protein
LRNHAPTSVYTQSGRLVKRPTYLQNYETGFFSTIEAKFYQNLWNIGELSTCGLSEEILAVGTTGSAFNNTAELKPMKYDEAMQLPDKAEWLKGVQAEHGRFVKHKVWAPVPKHEIPHDAKILSSTWAMKQKPDGTKRCRLNTRGFEQVDGQHCESNDIAAPVVSNLTIRICFALLAMTGWYAHLMDVKGAFLTSEFGNGRNYIWMCPRDLNNITQKAQYCSYKRLFMD